MTKVIAISGSPATSSRTQAVLGYTLNVLSQNGIETALIRVRDLPAEDLLYGRYNSAAILAANEQVAQAQGVIIATPVYKAAYTGVLKSYLDLLPQTGLAGKVVLPIATGGTLAHLLSIDYSLKPLISALGSRQVLQGVYVVDKQVRLSDQGEFELDGDVLERLDQALAELRQALSLADNVAHAPSLVVSGV
ncbi:MAG: NADPH-dependent FMN reductase [Synechococcales cyanobacterium]